MEERYAFDNEEGPSSCEDIRLMSTQIEKAKLCHETEDASDDK